MKTTQTQVRFDSRSTTAVISTGRRSRKMSPCTVTNSEGTTVVTSKDVKKVSKFN